jgi:enterobactin synthetase component D
VNIPINVSDCFGTQVTVELALPTSAEVHAILYTPADFTAQMLSRVPKQLQASVEARRHAFIAGRYCAARALTKAGFTGEKWLPIGDDRLPVWPDGWQGSISHSQCGAIAVAVRDSICRSIGVDLEETNATDRLIEIASTIARPDELNLFKELPQEQRVALLFSAKEALYKALFPEVRRFFDFSAAFAISSKEGILQLALAQSWAPNWPTGSIVATRYSFQSGHVFTAVCLLRKWP